MQTNNTFQKINKKPKQQGQASIKAKANKSKHIDKRDIWSQSK